MDTKYSSPEMFKLEIKRFPGGQIQFRSVYKETFRGKPKSINFDAGIHPRRFSIQFEWFVQVRPVFTSTDGLPFLVGEGHTINRIYSMSFDLHKFYFPKSPFFRKGDRRRIKWTTSASGEEFRLFAEDDIARMEFNNDGDLISQSPVIITDFYKGVPTTIQPP